MGWWAELEPRQPRRRPSLACPSQRCARRRACSAPPGRSGRRRGRSPRCRARLQGTAAWSLNGVGFRESPSHPPKRPKPSSWRTLIKIVGPGSCDSWQQPSRRLDVGVLCGYGWQSFPNVQCGPCNWSCQQGCIFHQHKVRLGLRVLGCSKAQAQQKDPGLACDSTDSICLQVARI